MPSRPHDLDGEPVRDGLGHELTETEEKAVEASRKAREATQEPDKK